MKPKVTWEDYCRVTQLCTAVLADNAQLREQRKMDNQTIWELARQRDELYVKLNELGYEPDFIKVGK